MLSRLLKFVAEMLEDIEGGAFEGTLEQEHISMLSEKKRQKILRMYGKVMMNIENKKNVMTMPPSCLENEKK